MIERKPEWLHVEFSRKEVQAVADMMNRLNLHTVCREANCPNMGECYRKRTATFLILGENCTRHCRFCNVSKNRACSLDPDEPAHVADAAVKLGLKHVVVTSVTRDDLPDGGAEHFVKTVQAIRAALPDANIELLVPDFKGDFNAVDTVVDAEPDIFAHNVETVPRLYAQVRPEADYDRSVSVLAYAKLRRPGMVTKTGIMVGLGETEAEVVQVMDDLVRVGVDILTVGQYLRPTKAHLPVAEYVTPQQFDRYARLGRERGLKYVFSAPLVRSSYHAAEAFDTVKSPGV